VHKTVRFMAGLAALGATIAAASGDGPHDRAPTPPAAPAKTEASAPAKDEPFSAEKTAQTCDACHGPGGNSVLAETPSLAGQTARYLYLQLKDFKEKRRENPLMSPMAANLDKAQMLALAQYYAEKKLKANDFKVASEKVRAGKAKAGEVLCPMCHLGGFSGQNEIPRVAGQRYDYIVKQLKDFKAMKRTNDAGNMTSVSKTLNDEDIDALAQYITSLN
jgi:cytochrome c553